MEQKYKKITFMNSMNKQKKNKIFKKRKYYNLKFIPLLLLLDLLIILFIFKGKIGLFNNISLLLREKESKNFINTKTNIKLNNSEIINNNSYNNSYNNLYNDTDLNNSNINNSLYSELNLNKREIDNYLSSISNIDRLDYKNEKNLLDAYLNLSILSKDSKDNSNDDAKKQLLTNLKNYNPNISQIKAVYIQKSHFFGNRMVMINHIMYFCEIFGWKNIYLNSEYNWYIKQFISDKFNISLISNSQVNCSDINIWCLDLKAFFMFPIVIKYKVRLNKLKEEIIRNLPQIQTDINDLYMHIRSGDIFFGYVNRAYAQPPLCFYEYIINKFKFRNIYIIAVDDRNPVIKKLLDEFPQIIFHKNSFENDLSLLVNAYNLVGSISSFLQTIILINNNLKKYFEYDIYRLSEKISHLHHDIYEYPRNFTIYKMKTSQNYRNKMFYWEMNPDQLSLMIEEKCTYNFTIIEPNV